MTRGALSRLRFRRIVAIGGFLGCRPRQKTRTTPACPPGGIVLMAGVGGLVVVALALPLSRRKGES